MFRQQWILMELQRDYVQDERYIAREHKDVRRDCVKSAQRIFTSMAAKVVQCLISGHAVNPSMGARTRLLSRTVLKQDTTPPRLSGY